MWRMFCYSCLLPGSGEPFVQKWGEMLHCADDSAVFETI
jgi:ribosomal protein L24E